MFIMKIHPIRFSLGIYTFRDRLGQVIAGTHEKNLGCVTALSWWRAETAIGVSMSLGDRKHRKRSAGIDIDRVW